MGKNNFDCIRIGLALMVVFSHVSSLTQLLEFNLLPRIFDANFAVRGFFAISGYLVTKSFLTSNNAIEYAEKRIRRIYPAYLAVILLCLCIGAYVTTLDFFGFIKSSETQKYLLSNLIFLNFIQPTLPLTFEENPVRALNGSLWTIKVEVMLYFCVPLLVMSYDRFGKIKSSFSIFFLSVAWVCFFEYLYKGNNGPEIARQFPGQLSYFVVGSLLAVDEKVLSNIKWISFASFAILLLITNKYLKLIIDPIAYSSIVVFLSASAFKSIDLGKYGDVSYGIYLYHFPIIQFLFYLKVFNFNPWLGCGLALILTVACAFVSWHLIEKRFLKRTSGQIKSHQPLSEKYAH